MDEHEQRVREEVGQELLRHREAREPKVTQTAAGEAAGVKRAKYQRWEAGKALPEPGHIGLLDAFYGLHGVLIQRYRVLTQGPTTLQLVREWAFPVKPPTYAGELYLLFQVPGGLEPVLDLSVEVYADDFYLPWRHLGRVDATGVALVGADPDPVRRIINVHTSVPVLINLERGYPPLPPERVIGVRTIDWRRPSPQDCGQ